MTKRKISNAPKGEDAPHSKLTAAVVRMLRRKLAEDGSLNCSAWARKLGMSQQAISFAVHPERKGGTWKHLKKRGGKW